MEERIGIQLAAIVPMSAWVKNGLVYAPKNARWVKIPHCRPTRALSDPMAAASKTLNNQQRIKMQTTEQTETRESGSLQQPGSAAFDSETVEAALKRTEATACAMKEPDCSDVLAAEVRKLRTALRDANDLCRSAYQVAVREGRETNWPAFRDCLSESLDRQHRVMYPPNAEVSHGSAEKNL